ncbi:sensor histidine kinase [Actinoallomurus rhizosphaericola]|uniref:sensor histidine kinase n=1 Tax=Actinoallomurus rhizosphaericola TaxID=2952536 RepID=UPI0020903A28|nr:sensor histidine kinase [Actinoallomurus rhizosphaericola]MCO5993751.1 sensor histidine kinase [Actinoallomurus rhizosphaericola]
MQEKRPRPEASGESAGSGTDVAAHIDDGPGPYGTYPWLLVGYSALSDVLHGRARPVWASGPLLALYVVLVVLAIWYGYRRGQGDRRAVVLLVAAGADAFILVGWFGHGMSQLMSTLALTCGVVLPWGRRPWPALVIAPLSVLAALLAWARGASAGNALGVWYGTLLSGFIIATMLRLFAAIRELRETRDELARTAVSEERLRFARDLHDLLGHTLSVMVVKAQAVRKIAARDPGLAAEQAADIEEIGRDALRQVRLAVTGYRGRGLDAEIDGARTALRDAGITARVRKEGTPLPAEADALLGWAVREGVTNVIRHSGAATCEISVIRQDGAAVLSVRDDGRGGPDPSGTGERPSGAADGPSGTGEGNGLRGLAERIGGAAGRLEAGPADGGGYLLTITLPLKETVG